MGESGGGGRGEALDEVHQDVQTARKARLSPVSAVRASSAEGQKLVQCEVLHKKQDHRGQETKVVFKIFKL